MDNKTGHNSCSQTQLVSDQGVVLQSTEFNQPLFSITPFDAEHLYRIAASYKQENCLVNAEPELIPNREHLLCVNGRAALDTIIKDIQPAAEQNIAIYTPSANLYISGCVTKTIDQHCNWIRETVNEQTAAILVNHEFGYAMSLAQMQALKAHGLPIIEDCAYALGVSYADGSKVGSFGDYALYSLPKMFPAQIGGLALSKSKLNTEISLETQKYVALRLAEGLETLDAMIVARRENHLKFTSILSPLGISPLLPLKGGDVPGVMLFKSEQLIDYPALKTYLWSMGVQCSVFYGMEAFYIPCHQYSSEGYMRMMYELLKNFLHGH